MFKMSVTDFSSIENWDITDHNKSHESDVNWLNAQVKSMAEKEPERTVVTFTHHRPTFLEVATNLRHKNYYAQIVSGFATKLSKEKCWNSTQAKLWAFGHTHFNYDFEDPHTKKRVFTDQKGYRRAESVTFDVVQMPKKTTFDAHYRGGNSPFESNASTGCAQNQITVG